MGNSYGPRPEDGTVWYDAEYSGDYFVVGDIPVSEAVGHLAWYMTARPVDELPSDLVEALAATAETVVMFRVLASQEDELEPGSWNTDGHGASLTTTGFANAPAVALDEWATNERYAVR